MPIIGIDDEKCIKCKLCYWDCPKLLFAVEEQTNKISFLSQYAETACIECGHCIAICPKNAIKYQGMEDIAEISDSEVVPNAYENLFSLIRGRRSIRKFKPDPVPEELIEKIMQAIRYAPTNGNVRTLTYAIISDQDYNKSSLIQGHQT